MRTTITRAEMEGPGAGGDGAPPDGAGPDADDPGTAGPDDAPPEGSGAAAAGVDPSNVQSEAELVAVLERECGACHAADGDGSGRALSSLQGLIDAGLVLPGSGLLDRHQQRG